ncbi:uncharacterized protein [Antedon mediterranea]|uniref:uncharacterized protein n=1 Tax=Antedon mediterranea TaxID=105859 RepID=UPI003AF8A060
MGKNHRVDHAVYSREYDRSINNNMWTDEITRYVIILWGEEKTSGRLQGNKKDSQMYKKIAKSVEKEFNVKLTVLQITNKLKNLRRQFTVAKDNNEKSGRERITCPFYDLLDNILGDRALHNPPHVMEGGQRLNAEENQDFDRQAIDNTTDDSELDGSNADAESVDESVDDSIEDPRENQDQPVQNAGAQPLKKKPKKTKLEQSFKLLTDMMSKQDEQLENRLLRQTEEQQQWMQRMAEAAEKSRREEHARMMDLFKMMVQQPHQQPQYYPHQQPQYTQQRTGQAQYTQPPPYQGYSLLENRTHNSPNPINTMQATPFQRSQAPHTLTRPPHNLTRPPHTLTRPPHTSTRPPTDEDIPTYLSI